MMIDLVDCIERGIEREENRRNFHKWAYDHLPENTREWDGTEVHSSDLGVIFDKGDTVCDRQLWMRIQGKESKDRKLGEKIMFDHGLSIQVRFSYLLALGMPENWSIKDILFIMSSSAEADLIINGPVGDVVVEVKTARGNAFSFLDDARPRHRLQTQCYMYEGDIDNGTVLYIDREGQNKPHQYPVERDDEFVEKAKRQAESIAEQELRPPVIGYADVSISKNKTTGDSVKIDLPWQCRNCPYHNHGCEGVLAEDEVKSGIIGRIDEHGNFYSDEYPEFVEVWEPYVYDSEDYQDIHGDGDDG